jgi:cytochrome c553
MKGIKMFKTKVKSIVIGAILSIGIFATAIFADDLNLNRCIGCHGTQFEKSALGKSKVVKDMNASEIVTALKGYKDGTYGGTMKGIMKGQVKDLNDTQIENIAMAVGK